MAISTAAAIVGSAVVGGVVAAKGAKDAAKAQSKSQKRAAAAVKEGTEQARADVRPLFDQAAQQRLGGFQGAQNIFSQSVPQQFDVFQQANQQAQQTTGLAPQQIQNALLGLPVDFGFLQPQQQFNPNFDFLNQSFVPEPVQAAQPAQAFDIQQFIDQAGVAGIGNEGGQNPFGQQLLPKTFNPFGGGF